MLADVLNVTAHGAALCSKNKHPTLSRVCGALDCFYIAVFFVLYLFRDGGGEFGKACQEMHTLKVRPSHHILYKYINP